MSFLNRLLKRISGQSRLYRTRRRRSTAPFGVLAAEIETLGCGGREQRCIVHAEKESAMSKLRRRFAAVPGLASGLLGEAGYMPRFVSPGLRNGKCVALLLLAMILGYAGAANAGTSWQMGDLTTYAQGSWGGDPGVDAGAALLVDKFDAVYASTGGVIVGSASGFTMVFTDASSVLVYQPSIGPYAPLNGSVLNPVTTASGAFGGDVLALEFNVDFSDAGFLPGTPGLRFGDLVLIDFSTFPQLNGLTVRQVLGDANTALSGGSSIISISDLGSLVSDLNASFSSGTPQQFAQDHLVAPSTPVVPEPSSWVLWGSGLLGLATIRRSKRRH